MEKYFRLLGSYNHTILYWFNNDHTNIFSDLIDLKGRFPLCISDPQDTAWVDSDLETFNSWWPSPNLTRCTNLNYLPGAGIKWSYSYAIMLVWTMPDFKSHSCWCHQLDGLFSFFISFWLFTTLLLQQARQLYPPLFCSQFSSKVLQNRKSLLARQPVRYSSNLTRHSRVSHRSCWILMEFTVTEEPRRWSVTMCLEKLYVLIFSFRFIFPTCNMI